MKILRLICRIIAGFVFMFSGFVKAIDPLGSAYKFHDYFAAFHLDFLQFLCLPLSIFLCTAEFLTGFSVLSGFRQKTGTWGLLILMVFFTPLTLILAVTNPVTDCGCFGDAIHLTNWQTFGKNILLFIIALVLFTSRKNIRIIFNPVIEWSVITGVVILFIGFSLLNYKYLPAIDFLPYKTGTNIPEKMKIPEGAQADEYRSTFIYEKQGKRSEFTLKDYPANDTTWKFVDQKSVLVKKGYEPPIHDFSITTLGNENITEKVLTDDKYSLLMISKKLAQSDINHLKEGFDVGTYCLNNGLNFYIMTSSGADEISNYRNRLIFCLTDETTLKTMMRSNPGYILLKNGTVIGKWSWANLPAKEWFSGDIERKQIELMQSRNEFYIVLISILTLTVVLMLLCILLTKINNRNKIF
jgi:hypothetical protein